ncbi:MAG: hypothetical protein JWN70_6800 [Planctomycetaceae bacterium]|nr:hypothetical protein [Planctomycetaceae bacterium]
MAIEKGLNITRESWNVLRADFKLLVFPMFSGLAAAAILVTVLAANILIPSLGEWSIAALRALSSKDPQQPLAARALGLGCLFVIYFVEWFVVIFFNTALVGCALRRLAGGQPTVGDGFRIAFQRLPQILAWTLFTSAVGTLLSAIEQQLGWLGKLAIRLLGVTWAVATYLVVPVLAAEGTGPLTAVRRSVALLKRTWGEGLVGHFTIQLLTSGVGILLVVLTTGGLLLAVFMESIIVAVATGTVLLLGLLTIAILTSAMRQVFLAALYHYATTGEIPSGFSESTLRQALKQS